MQARKRKKRSIQLGNVSVVTTLLRIVPQDLCAFCIYVLGVSTVTIVTGV